VGGGVGGGGGGVGGGGLGVVVGGGGGVGGGCVGCALKEEGLVRRIFCPSKEGKEGGIIKMHYQLRTVRSRRGTCGTDKKEKRKWGRDEFTLLKNERTRKNRRSRLSDR